jgi:acyl-CoA synthetase (AMP-forming)/AMP-acid ligase II
MTNSTSANLPAMTRDEAISHLLENDRRFQTTTATIRGEVFTVFKNAPASVGELLQSGMEARGSGETPYLLFEGERWTYGQFCDEAFALAHALHARFDVKPGDRVGLCSRNCPEMLFGIMAIALLGGTVVFLNSWWTTSELDVAIKDSDVKLILADVQRCERLLPLKDTRDLTLVCYRDEAPNGALPYAKLMENKDKTLSLPVKVDTDSDFAIMYTSGSSGTPKGVILTHRGAVSASFSGTMLDEIAYLINPQPELPNHHLMIVTPLFHVTATHPCFLWSVVAGAQITVFPKWDAEKAVTTIRDEDITRIIGVPTQSADLLQAAQRMGESLPSLATINSGGAKRPEAQVGALAEAFPAARIGSGYGLTETNALGMLVAGPDYVERPATCGRLIPPLQEMRFLDDDGNDVPHGEVGELVLRGPNLMRGYLNKPEATAEVLQNGWFHTGDLARVDEDGFVYIVDRKKDIIIRGGENIACLEVDGALHLHPDVAEASVFSMPDDRLGEIVGAGIWRKPDCQTSADEITAFLKDRLAHFKIPARIWFLDGPLPRTATAKIDRRALRAQCLNES